MPPIVLTILADERNEVTVMGNSGSIGGATFLEIFLSIAQSTRGIRLKYATMGKSDQHCNKYDPAPSPITDGTPAQLTDVCHYPLLNNDFYAIAVEGNLATSRLSSQSCKRLSSKRNLP